MGHITQFALSKVRLPFFMPRRTRRGYCFAFHAKADVKVKAVVMSVNVERFVSFEKQNEGFTELTELDLLPTTAGRLRFYRELGEWATNYHQEGSSLKTAFISPNPSQGFCFPTPFDVLSSALMLHQNPENISSLVMEYLSKSGLTESKAHQPITTLSGGEILQLNFAKASASLPSIDQLVACSPLYWLNDSKYVYWENLVSEYQEHEKSIEVLLLTGERYPYEGLTLPAKNNYTAAIDDLDWELCIESTTIEFPETKFPSYCPKFEISFEGNPNTLTLSSPTLITGDNGVGKSIFAKLMAGILRPTSGAIQVTSKNGKTPARMLFQHSTMQLFGMSIEAHSKSIFQFDKGKQKEFRRLYKEIDGDIRNLLSKIGFDYLDALGPADSTSTLLQANIALVAERIIGKPSLLILDEPTWGLARIVSECFVTVTCKYAHKNGLAVAIITHQSDWWDTLAKSEISLAKSEDSKVVITPSEESQ